MDTLPLELLRTICLNLVNPDISHFIQANSKTLQISTEHFWFSKIQQSYPQQIEHKPNDLKWIEYYWEVFNPYVTYTEIYLIDLEFRQHCRGKIMLYPDYTWKPLKPLEREVVIKSAKVEKQAIATQMKSEFSRHAMFRPLCETPSLELREIFKKMCPDFEELKHASKKENTLQSRASLALIETLLGIEPDQSEIDFIDNPNKIYLLTTDSYDLIALIGSESKLVVAQQSYPDAKHIFALTSDIPCYDCLSTALQRLNQDDEIGFSYLLEGIKLFCSQIKVFDFSKIFNDHLQNLMSHCQ